MTTKFNMSYDFDKMPSINVCFLCDDIAPSDCHYINYIAINYIACT